MHLAGHISEVSKPAGENMDNKLLSVANQKAEKWLLEGL